MSSETSTRVTRKPRNAPAASRRQAAGGRGQPDAAAGEPQADGGVRPWHLFVVGGFVASTGGALATHGTSPANIVFTCLAIMTASAAGFYFYRTLWPLVSAEAAEGPEMLGGRTRAALEREKFLTLRAIKDLEFDRAMGKVSEADCQEMITRLRARAVRLIRQLDSGAAGYRELIEREISARLGDAPAGSQPAGGRPVSEPQSKIEARPPRMDEDASGPAGSEVVCPECQAVNDSDARFCKRCGTKLTVLA